MSNEPPTISYQPPLLRITASYEVAPGSHAPNTVDIEINDPGMAVSADLVDDIVATLWRAPAATAVVVSATTAGNAFDATHMFTRSEIERLTDRQGGGRP